MGAAREKKLRQARREANQSQAMAEDASKETLHLLHLAYRNMKIAGEKIAWYESCIQEFQRQVANGLVTVYV